MTTSLRSGRAWFLVPRSCSPTRTRVPPLLSAVLLASLLAGLLLGVRTMIVGVERPDPRGVQPRAALSAPTIATAATVFGLVGYLLHRYTTLGDVPVVAIAAVLAAAAAAGMVALIARWAVPSAAAEPPDPRYLLQGTPARVTRAMEGEARGEVEYRDEHGAPHATPAISFDGSPLATGAEVVIDRIEDGVAYVEAWALVEKRL